jgi:hypothetical protein
MKKLLLIAGLFLASTTYAASNFTGTVELNVVNATYAPAHAMNPGKGSLTLNYDKHTVRLMVVRNGNPCPAGMLCTLEMPAPLIVELPITSIDVDSCGIKHVVARKDLRPVDGALEQITVSDSTSKLTCLTFVQGVPEATYETRYFNRRTGQEVVDQSKMVLALKNADSLAPAILVKLEQNSGFAPQASALTLYIDVTGRVVANVRKSGKTTSTILAQLSNPSLQNIKDLVAGVSTLKTELVDQDPNAPMCMDAPVISVSVVVNGQDKVIRRLENCHTSSLEDYRAYRLSELISGLQTLGN